MGVRYLDREFRRLVFPNQLGENAVFSLEAVTAFAPTVRHLCTHGRVAVRDLNRAAQHLPRQWYECDSGIYMIRYMQCLLDNMPHICEDQLVQKLKHVFVSDLFTHVCAARSRGWVGGSRPLCRRPTFQYCGTTSTSRLSACAKTGRSAACLPPKRARNSMPAPEEGAQ